MHPWATCWILQNVIFMISWLIKHQLVEQAAALVVASKNEDRLSLAKTMHPRYPWYVQVVQNLFQATSVSTGDVLVPQQNHLL